MMSDAPRKVRPAWQCALVLVLVLAGTLLNGCTTRRTERISIAPSRGVPSIWPIADADIRITSRFGDRAASQNGGFHSHRGIDIAAPKGTPVIATADGRVTCAEYNKGGYGKLVKIAHAGGIETWYAHLNSLDVKEDRRVGQGKRIGRVGKTGRTTGFHVHYEVHVDGAPVDPRRFLPSER